MIDVNELLEIAIKEAENLVDAEMFLVKDLYLKATSGIEYHEMIDYYLGHYF